MKIFSNMYFTLIISLPIYPSFFFPFPLPLSTFCSLWLFHFYIDIMCEYLISWIYIKMYELQMRGKKWFFSWSCLNLLNKTISSYIFFLQISWLQFLYDWKYFHKIWYNFMYYICNLENPTVFSITVLYANQ